MPTHDSIGHRIRGILSEGHDMEKLAEMLPIWRESYKLTMELAGKSFLQLVFFFLLFALIDRAEVTKASLFGIEFNNLSAPYAILFSLSVIIFYRLVSLVCFAQLTEDAIREAYYQCYKKFQINGLTELTIYPSLPQIESTFENLEHNKRSLFAKTAFVFMLFESSALVIIPLLGFLWASYALIRSSLIDNVLSISVVSVAWLVILRALVLSAHVLRFAGRAT
jgi:cytochrome bd-type quinol oxidase subunit 2